MKKSLGAKPIVYPTPVFLVGSYDDKGIANMMNAA
ncbi:MAG: flavoredoxin, partial [Desulfobacteraceae bacterium 4572_35.2]